MKATSEEEIRVKYPELSVVPGPPEWMTKRRYEQIRAEEMHDIDGPPWGILKALLSDRES